MVEFCVVMEGVKLEKNIFFFHIVDARKIKK
jgi:hypothetical protein